jgi:glycosyltransferase involved in cell wall biosynthesis
LPRVSVILPSYNHERFVAIALESVLAQTYQDFEIVITDDASTDGSVGVLTAYQQRDSRIKLFLNRVNYERHSVNHCIENSSGEYVAVLSSDDEFFPTKLEEQVAFLDDHSDVAAVFTNARIVNEQGRALADPTHFYQTIFEQPNRSRHEWLNHFFFKGNCLCHPSVLIRRSVYETLGLYNPLLGALDDLDMWVRLCLHHDIHVLPQKLLNYRVLDREANFSGDKPENFRRSQFEWVKILDHFATPNGVAQIHLIFPNVASEVWQRGDAVARHVLAELALETGQLSHRFWGIDLLYRLLSQGETKRALAHRISVAPEGDFVKANGQINPFTAERRPAAQVFWPVARAHSETSSRSLYYRPFEWVDLRIPIPTWDTAGPLRLDPCDFPCVIKIPEVRILSRTDGRCLWRQAVKPDVEAVTLAGTALWLADGDGGAILSTGMDPQLYFAGIPALPDLPLELQAWIKVETGLESVGRELESLRAALRGRDAERATREANAATLRAKIADAEGERERLCAQVTGLRAAFARQAYDAERETDKLRATVTAGDRQRAKLSEEGLALQAAVDQLRDKLARRETEIEALRIKLVERDGMLETCLNSRSWRYTYPLRALRRFIGRD